MVPALRVLLRFSDSLSTMNLLTNDDRGTLLNQDHPWPQTIGEQTQSISAVHHTDSGVHRYVLPYACLHIIEEGIR